MPEAGDFDPIAFVRSAIAELRRELLDFSTRNKLLSFKHPDRGGDFIRVIDELPAEIFGRLAAGGMLFKPLPHATEIPADETTKPFRSALDEARHNDRDYLEAVAKSAAKDDDGGAAFRIERQLRDRVRAALGLDRLFPRADRLDLAAFARANGINPEYSLPMPVSENPPHHEDQYIQTLLLPDDLDRKVRKIYQAYQDHIQEKGINVLNAAFGFLEWYEDDASSVAHHAPLLLAPLTMERLSERGQTVYRLTADPDESEVNVTLLEFLKQKHHLTLPPFVTEAGPDAPESKTSEEPPRLEPWLNQVTKVISVKRRWRVCRFVTIGTFPFSRIALYKDLGHEGWGDGVAESHDIVARLLGGRGSGSATGQTSHVPDYPVDNPQFPQLVPRNILEADSSQHSAIVDAVAGKSFVIQGPPGTGKSQTIANIIAAALDADKRVLFMAEKSAALNVVSSRLKDIGLGPFLFEVHSDKTRKSDVIASLSERLALKPTRTPIELERKLGQRRSARDRLARYVELMSQPVGALARPLQQLMWFANRYGSELDEHLPHGMTKTTVPHALAIDQSRLDEHRAMLEQLADARDTILASGFSLTSHPWRGTGETNPFRTETIAETARAVHQALQELVAIIEDLGRAGISLPDGEHDLESWLNGIGSLPGFDEEPRLLTLCFQAGEQIAQVADFIERYNELTRDLVVLVDPGSAEPAHLAQWLEGCDKLGVEASLTVLARAYAKAEAEAAELDRDHLAVRDIGDYLDIGAPIPDGELLALIRAITLFCTAPDDVLHVRTPAMKEEASERLIATAGRQATALRRREQALAVEFDLTRARHSYSGGELYRASDALATANIVTQFASEVRNASRTWQGLARNPKSSDRKTKSSHLKDLAEHLNATQEFAANPRWQALFGPNFNGHDTNFDLYAAAAALLRDASTTLGDAAPTTQAAANRKIVDEGLRSIRRLRTRFPHDHLVRLERRLSDLERLKLTLDEAKRHAHGRCSDLRAALQSGQVLVRSDAVVRTGRGSDGTWSLVATLGEWQNRRAVLMSSGGPKDVFGREFPALISDPRPLRLALAKVRGIAECGLPPSTRAELAAARNPAEYLKAATSAAPRLTASLSNLHAAWRRFATCAQLDEAVFANATDVADTSFGDRLSRIDGAICAADALPDWMRYRSALDAVAASPAGAIVQFYTSTDVAEPRLADIFELCLVRTLIRLQLDNEGRELADLTGSTLADARTRFSALDKELLGLEAQHIAAKVAVRPVDHGNDSGPRSTWSGRALIENEAKKKRHIPLRDLIQRSQRALGALKPVWMMSPLTVAQYLPRIESFFDLVIIDEASQMKPADAIGGLVRAHQAIIVGDPMQLPPTDFFGTSIDQSDEQQSAAAGQSSILDLAEARLRQTRMLRWHYRSRHESLIAFSNRHFYDNRLVVFPTATVGGDLGVETVYVGGRYLGGGTNPDEAQAIVERARQVIEANPDLSLGLVTTNAAQMELVREELDKLASTNRKVADYWAHWQDTLEPLFVKNLENVQGDERDTILISTVFGPGETGQVAQRFGPINSESGHRRLNVLFTRAKRKIVLVTSLRANDILPSPASNPGVHALKEFLEFASTGRIASGAETGLAPDSDFEVHVAERLRRAGYEPVPQVGVDGFRIDIGIRHASWPHGFLAGIECDGAAYHSGVTVRDRDRLRQEILEGLGWKLYRIWSTDWFASPEREMTKLLAWLDELRLASRE